MAGSAAAKKPRAQDKPVEPILEAVPAPPEVPESRQWCISAYPEGARLFWYQPKGGGDEIALPIDISNPPDKLFYFDLDEVRTNRWLQLKRYLDRFEVPKGISRRAFEVLEDGELMDMCTAWLKAVGEGVTAGN